MFQQNQSRFSISEKVGNLWCRMRHAGTMWPIGATYRCAICGRSYPVPWADDYMAQPAPIALERRARIVESRAA
jgi:hypothetical protein